MSYARLVTERRDALLKEAPLLLESQLELGELDLIITSFPTNSASIIGERLIVEDIKLVMSKDHPLPTKKRIRSSDLWNDPGLANTAKL